MNKVLKINCPIKLNITLFVASKRPNGYHNLFSIFLKKNATEVLTINSTSCNMLMDVLSIKNAIICGENLVTKSLKLARGKMNELPYFDITLEKFYPTGSGIGAGSGNAAAVLDFLHTNFGVNFSMTELSTLGADIPFLTQSAPLAFVKGIGEIIEPLESTIALPALLLFPDWQINTALAYKEIDEINANKQVSDEFYVSRSLEIVSLLKANKHVGLLPNDFWHVARNHHNEYDLLAREAEETSALAYGLSGSGSCFFALYDSFGTACTAQSTFNKFNFIKKRQVI
ncbi:MAG: hypothetical protein Q4C78_02375 [Synergistaceae bacterium]|nr:hypothetical protein [Synergistaceae bacterium]